MFSNAFGRQNYADKFLPLEDFCFCLIIVVLFKGASKLGTSNDELRLLIFFLIFLIRGLKVSVITIKEDLVFCRYNSYISEIHTQIFKLHVAES